jgi:hypothetical protein
MAPNSHVITTYPGAAYAGTLHPSALSITASQYVHKSATMTAELMPCFRRLPLNLAFPKYDPLPFTKRSTRTKFGEM